MFNYIHITLTMITQSSIQCPTLHQLSVVCRYHVHFISLSVQFKLAVKMLNADVTKAIKIWEI